MAFCSGLPICLSAIRLLPPQTRPSAPVALPCTPPTTSAASHITTHDSIADFGSSHTSSNSRLVKAKWPRFAVAKEMADLDRRREAMKKQRYLQNAVYLLEVYRLQNEYIRACLERQSSTLQDQSDSTQNVCAKAA